MRTDSSFRNRDQPIHHKEKSILENLINFDGLPLIDMVKQFITSDPLHLLEQGVMKRLLRVWTNGTAIYKQKWTKETIAALGLKIFQWNKEFPGDIHRKLRGLQFVKYFKATEFRTLLLYIGIVAFKDILEEKIYIHFLHLCLATRICSCRSYVRKYKQVARVLYSDFCANFGKIYGNNEIVSNIHNISHIADDVDNFGTLNEMSTYPFENRLRDLKLKIQPTNAPLKQVTRRLGEICLDEEGKHSVNLDTRKFEKMSWVPELKYGFRQLNKLVYRFIQVTPNMYLSSKNIANRWFLTKTGEIVQFNYATIAHNSYLISGTPVKDKRDFFILPYSSSKSDIFISNGTKSNEKMFHVSDLKAKFMCVSYHDEFVFIPLLHTIDELEDYCLK